MKFSLQIPKKDDVVVFVCTVLDWFSRPAGLAGLVGAVIVLAGLLLFLGGDNRPLEPIGTAGSDDYAAFMACSEHIGKALDLPQDEIRTWSTYRVEIPYDETRKEMVVLSWVVIPRRVGGDRTYNYECHAFKSDGKWALREDGLILRE